MSLTWRGRVPNGVEISSVKSFTYGTSGLTTIDELRARLDRDVDVGRRDDAAVDELAVVDLDGLVDHRQRGRGARRRARSARRPSRRRRRRSARRCRGRSPRGRARCSSARKSSVRSGSESTVAHVALDARAGVEAGRQVLGEPERDVHRADLPPLRGEVLRELRHAPAAAARRSCANSSRLSRRTVPDVDVAERRRHLLVDDPHHLLGRDPVGGERRDERAGARADVDVELVDGAVDREQVERAQRADLVDAAREAAAAEDERGLAAARAATTRARRRALGRGASLRLVEIDDLPHSAESTARCGRAGPSLSRRTDARLGADLRETRPIARYRAAPCGLPDASRPPFSARSRCCSRSAPASPALDASAVRRVAGARRRSRRRDAHERARGRPHDRDDALRARRRRPADPGIGPEALHDRDRAAPLRAGRPARDDRRPRRRARRGRDGSTATSSSSAAATRRSTARRSPASRGRSATPACGA